VCARNCGDLLHGVGVILGSLKMRKIMLSSRAVFDIKKRTAG
jgi:hypothetical protein